MSKTKLCGGSCLRRPGTITSWTVALENGALVTFTQDRVRIANSYTHRRGITDERMRGIVRKEEP